MCKKYYQKVMKLHNWYNLIVLSNPANLWDTPASSSRWPSFDNTRTTDPNEGINQKYLKIWADVADKICCGHTYFIWNWDWIFGRAVKNILSLGVRSPCDNTLQHHHTNKSIPYSQFSHHSVFFCQRVTGMCKKYRCFKGQLISESNLQKKAHQILDRWS